MTQSPGQQHEMRWKDYVLLRGEDLAAFWRDHCHEPGRKLLFVAGRGFDPRTALGLEQFVALSGTCALDLLALEFDEGESHPPQALVDAAAENWSKLQSCIVHGQIDSKAIRFRSEDGRRIAARSAANVISREAEIEGYTDIVVDVSAMPRGVYFPLISRLIFFHDKLKEGAHPAPNIHVLVLEDPTLDSQIREHGIDETASFLHPFEGDFNREATGVSPRIWIPVLGEGRTTQFDRIYDLVKPDEVCPVLPSPSRKPRRGDDIVMEYRDLLFDQLRVDPRNFIYSSEVNPFEVYRQIRRTALHYHEVLGLIGGCKVAFSPLCSKLMSLGVLLVAYEMKTTGLLNAGIAHIECQGYEMPESVHLEVEQVGLWLAGECYG
jgi:hypothetical protein